MVMMEGFDAGALERRYAFLDDCPEPFLERVVTLPVGTLAERVTGLRAWRDALLLGDLPPTETWPPAEIAAPARLAAIALGILPFCKDQPELVDAFLHDVLASFARRDQVLRSEVADELRRLEQLARASDFAPLGLDTEALERLRRQAEHEVAQRVASEDSEVVAAWSERTRTWAALVEVFGDLGAITGRGWDLSNAVLKHIGWMEVARLRELLAQLPQVREIVQSLGRLHAADRNETVAERVFVPMRRVEEERHEVWSNRFPVETRGIEHSGEIARMLPVEAINLGHPKLRYLWHARRAERALLTYRVEGIEVERRVVEREGQETVETRRPRLRRGPIIAVVDTSGSMHGVPERVAKALVLEALRTAHVEKRRCLVFAYGGPGQVIEHELELTPDGIGRLLAFLTMSFGGGSDETGVMIKVLDRLDASGWTKADVVFVSDGEWPSPTHLTPRLSATRAKGTRFHGVQIGNRGRTGLHTVCDPVHMFQDWAAAGGWR
jgi:uncharacterized protein with von Willebrand factor type A (vWA) domain